MEKMNEMREGVRWSVLVCVSAIALSVAGSDGLAAAPPSLRAQRSADGVWQDSGVAAPLSRDAEGSLKEPGARSFRLNPQALTRILRGAPLETARRSAGTELSLPMPDGTFSKFRIEESPVVAPGPEIGLSHVRTYRARGVDDPTATGRLSWTGSRLHALILSERASFFVEPRSRNDDRFYVSSDARDSGGGSIRCGVTANRAPNATAGDEIEKFAAQALPGPTFGTALRVYRLAVAATVEYTSTVSGGETDPAVAKELAYEEIVATVNAANAVYERDLAIRLVLLPKVEILKIIYHGNPIADPYTSGNTGMMVAENQQNLDNVILSANYDIGIVFDDCSGGLSAGKVCSAASKGMLVAGGVCEIESFKFQTHYLIHEAGHQFTAPHTFNYQDLYGQYTPSSAYEPGSGSTIMSYAGCPPGPSGCDNESLQIFPDRYFHSSSIAVIDDYVTNGAGNCASLITTSNQPPAASAGADSTIPKHTPFALTGAASDADSDPLGYCWEEYDLGAPNPPNNDADGQARPILRSFPPTADPSRIFPSLAYIRDNSNDPPEFYEGTDKNGNARTYLVGQSLPMIARVMTFRLTVRDGQGGLDTDDMLLNVDGSSGPFAVKYPNNAVVWPADSSQTVTWDPAGSANAPVSCANVNLLLSLDGALTFPIVLAANTPNDGSQTITLPPGLSSNRARVKAEAVGNVFFDVSDEDFVINQAPEISCPANITVNNDPGECAAAVDFSASASDDQSDVAVSCVPPSGSSFGRGTTPVACTATDLFGATDTCGFDVTVNDAEGPTIRDLSATPKVLWPPNHKMVDVVIGYDATDNCDAASLVSCTLTVSSNEPEDGTGDGDQAPDWEVVDAHHVRLRAERAGNGNGRIYTIGVACTDGSNNSSSPADALVNVSPK